MVSRQATSVRSLNSLESRKHDMAEHYIVSNPDGPDFEFDGQCVARVSEAESGTIIVYRTNGGSFIVEQSRSALRGRRPLFRVELADNPDQLQRILRDSVGGKKALLELGMPYRRRID